MDVIKYIFLVIYYLVDILILVYLLYYFFTGIPAFFNKKRIYKYRPKNKFAIIVPARNEENVISTLIESLKTQHYPKKLYDIYIIPNNCSDNTREKALKENVNVIDLDYETRCKGDVLKYSFEYLNEKNYDAFCIFDADNIVHPDFLKNMNNALCSGFKVAQGYRDSKNPKDTWISSCYALFYYVQNFFFNQARMNMGWSSSINGTGFMISKEMIQKYGFNTKTITEDIEYSAICALNGEKIAFVKNAITYDEQPLDFIISIKQRMRWSFGTLQCLKLYSLKLLNNFFKKKEPQSLDMSIFFLAPIFQIISFGIIPVTMIFKFLDINYSSIISVLYDNKIISIVLGYIVSIIISIIVILFDKKRLCNVQKGILTLSIFMLTWIPINFACMSKKKFEWEPISHTRNIDIKSIV